MSLKKVVSLAISHAVIGVVGFAAGIYALPILTAPPPPAEVALSSAAELASFRGDLRRDLAGSDALHWGEGSVFIGPDAVTFRGELAPGPDYKLYLSPEFVETEEAFNRHRANMALVGDVKTFRGFILELPADVDPTAYSSVVVWCESFGQFISAARYERVTSDG